MKKTVITSVAILGLANAVYALCYVNVTRACPAQMYLSNPPFSCTADSSASFPTVATAASGQSSVAFGNPAGCTYACDAVYNGSTLHLTGAQMQTSKATGGSCGGS